MLYLIMRPGRAEVVSAEQMRNLVDAGEIGGCRIFRICGMNNPVELFVKYGILTNRYGNAEALPELEDREKLDEFIADWFCP